MINKSGIISGARRNLLFDIQDGAYGAYSLRYLNREYNGDVILGHRDSDNAERGFTPMEIVDGTLTTWGAGDIVRVKTWYDQSGNQNAASQSVKLHRPSVVVSGTQEFLSGTIPSLNFNTNDFLPLDSALPDIDIGSCSSFVVGKFDDIVGSTQEVMFSLGTTSGAKRWYAPTAYQSEFNWGYGNTWNMHQETQDTDPHLFTTIAGTTQGNWQPFIDGTSLTSKTLQTGATSGTYGIGGLNSATSFELDGKIAEVIVYSSDQSAKRTALEKNIMDYYGIS